MRTSLGHAVLCAALTCGAASAQVDAGPLPARDGGVQSPLPDGGASLPAPSPGEGIQLVAWGPDRLKLVLGREGCADGNCRGRVELLRSGTRLGALSLTGVFPDGPARPGQREAGRISWSFQGTEQTHSNGFAAGDAIFSSQELRLGRSGKAVYLEHVWVPPAEGLPVAVHRVFLVEPSAVKLILEITDPGYEGQGMLQIKDLDGDGIDEIVLSGGSFDLPSYAGKLIYRWDHRTRRFASQR